MANFIGSNEHHFIMTNNSKSVLNFPLFSVPAELPAGQNVLDTNAISL